MLSILTTRSNQILRRIAQGGRNWEVFGADPYLTGEAAYETILGMQQGGVQACAKHFINKYAYPTSDTLPALKMTQRTGVQTNA